MLPNMSEPSSSNNNQPRGRHVTLADVARLAKISEGTASRVMSGSRYPVAHATRERVLAAAKSLGYIPNAFARTLATGRTRLVSVLVHDLSDSYYAQIVRGIQDRAANADAMILVGNDTGQPEALQKYLSSLASYRPDGLILAGGEIKAITTRSHTAAALSRFRESGTSVVLLGRYELEMPSVTVENIPGAQSVTSHLLQLGHTDIAFIGGSDTSATINDRRTGFRDALKSKGLRYHAQDVYDSELSVEGGRRAIRTVMSSARRYTAAVAATDDVAIGVMHELHELGIGVPDSFSVTGFNDIPIAQYTTPALTTVRIAYREMGAAAWDILVAARSRLNGSALSKVMATSLTVRNSTNVPPL